MERNVFLGLPTLLLVFVICSNPTPTTAAFNITTTAAPNATTTTPNNTTTAAPNATTTTPNTITTTPIPTSVLPTAAIPTTSKPNTTTTTPNTTTTTPTTTTTTPNTTTTTPTTTNEIWDKVLMEYLGGTLYSFIVLVSVVGLCIILLIALICTCVQYRRLKKKTHFPKDLIIDNDSSWINNSDNLLMWERNLRATEVNPANGASRPANDKRP